MSTASNFLESADAIVIGSGAGGAAVAYKLAKSGLRVIVLEKGRELARDGSTLDIERVVHRGEFVSHEPWLNRDDQTFLPQEHFNIGGKTKWYGAALIRFSKREFSGDTAYGARGWPIPYEDLAPYYTEAERMLGVQTFRCEKNLQSILEGLGRDNPDWKSSPMPLALSRGILGDPNEASHFDGFASAADLKGDAENSLLAAVRELPNVQVCTDAEVAELLPAGADPTVIGGVRLLTGSVVKAHVVVLAAGALHSPRLLARYVTSTGQESLPMTRNIGRSLKLHLLTALVAVSISRKSDLLRKTMLTVNEKFPHSSLQPLGFDGELIGTLVPKWVPRFLARQVGKRAYGFFLQTEDGSSRDNRVYERLDSGGGSSKRVLDYDETRVPNSSKEHREFVQAFRMSLLKMGYLSFSQRIGLDGTAHVCGTLSAGAESQDAVVNSRGGVFGLNGLYVADGSVLPRISRVNPSLSIYAWGLRVGHLLSEQLRSSMNSSSDGVEAVGRS
jgi:choline dehydrogenase-like flavoprotein